MRDSSTSSSSVDIGLIHPVRLDDIDSGMPQSSQNSLTQSAQLPSLSTSRAPYLSTYDHSLVSMQLAGSDSSTDNFLDPATFTTPTMHTSRVGSAPVISHHHSVVGMSMAASLVDSLGYSSRAKLARGNTSPVNAGGARTTFTDVHLDPPTNTPSVSGKLSKTRSPAESPLFNQTPKHLAQLSQRLAFKSRKNDAIYTMTKVPQVVSFTSASPTQQQDAMPRPSARSAQAQYHQSSPARYSLSSPLELTHQRNGLTSLYPLSSAAKLYRETSQSPPSRTRLVSANKATPSTITPTMQLRPTPRSKSPTRPTTVSSSFQSMLPRNLNSNRQGGSPINQTPPLSPRKASSIRPGSHLIVRPSPLLKLGGAIHGPYTSVPAEFPLQIRSVGHANPRKSARSTSISNTLKSTEITVHKDKRFRPVSPDGNTFITIFSPTINNPSNPRTFHLNETTVVTKTSVGWIKLNTDCDRKKVNSETPPRRPSIANKFE